MEFLLEKKNIATLSAKKKDWTICANKYIFILGV